MASQVSKSKPLYVPRVDGLVCSTCHDRLFNGSSFHQLRQKGITYATTWRDIQTASGKGCGWCDMIHYELGWKLHIMQDEDQTEYQGYSSSNEVMADMLCQNPQQKFHLAVSLREEKDGSLLMIVQYEKAEEDGDAWGLSIVSVSAPCDDVAAKFIPTRPLIYDMACDETFRLARACLDECLQCQGDHADCPMPVISPLPTRVIDCNDPAKPKLKPDTAGIEEPYIALSYVWGEDQPQKLTSANISRYTTMGLHLPSTPKTILDAVRVTRELGFRYLWVDSYCIIQDSTEDKATEIRNMRSIFRNARLTIIAAKTGKVSEGFLKDCPPPETFVVPFGEVGSMVLSPRAWDTPYETTKEQTNSRGWCLEEKILTPRALVYASNTLQFLCQKGLVNVGGSVTSSKRTGIDRLPAVFYRQSIEDADANDTVEVVKLWHAVLRDFTPRNLTRVSDRLNSIAGVAEEFHLRIKGRYIAGLWEQHLIGDLLWSKLGGDPLPLPRQYRAPSWSWASIDGIVFHPFGFVDRHEVRVEVLKCQVDLARPDFAYGAVTDGYLKVKGKFGKVTWNSDRGFVRGPSGAILGGGHPDRLEDLKGNGEEEEVWALLLAVRQPTLSPNCPVREGAQKRSRLAGLLLKRHDGQRDCYRRVGFLDLQTTEEVEKLFEGCQKEVVTIM